MNKNTKRVLSAITVASLSVTSFTGNIQNVVNAKEDKQEENALSTNRVNAEVLENEAGAVIRVSASSNVQNVKTTYSVDSAGSKVVSFGDLKAGEVREIQVNFEEDSNKLKSLPKTTAVSDRVDFNKEVRGHKIKGSVSFEYDNGDTAPVVTPTVPTTPTKPVVTTPSNPTEPTKPVVTPSNPNAKKVTLRAHVHAIHNGIPRVLSVVVYEDVEVGTKVSLDYVKEVLKQYDYEVEKLEGFPAVLDKDYGVDVNAIYTKEPKKDEPTTPTKPGLVKPLDPNNPVKPSFPAGQVQKVDLKINVHTVEDGKPVTMLFRAYGSVDVGTKVDPEYVKGVIRSYGYEIVKIGDLPEVLDKTYTVDADAKLVTPAEPTKPVEPAKPVTPGVAKPEGKKVNLMINRHGIVNGLPSVATFWIYKDVEIGTKVDFDSVKEFLKQYGFGEDYLKKFPAVLDKDYIVDVYLNADGEPTKPVTPGVTKPDAKKVNLEVNVHATLHGQPRVFTITVYEDVEVGTKVSLEYVKKVLKENELEATKLEGFPAVLDKDYAVDVEAVSTHDPKKDEPRRWIRLR